MSVQRTARGGSGLFRARLADFLELTKPRITMLVVVTAAMGYVLAAPAHFDGMLLFHTLIGTALVCAGTSTLNQVWEVTRDARMQRTQRRPLPAGRLSVEAALLFGVLLSLAGLGALACRVNLLAALVAGFTLASYVFVYTPLKSRTWLCTIVGAVPGAMPPVIGWAAARGSLGAGAWALFALLFVWQLPHFYAIAWMYREDYARGGFPMLGVIDPDGRRTAVQIAGWSAALLPASLLPAGLGLAGALYATGALVLGGAFALLAAGMVRHCTAPRARRVFFASILYLPALGGLLVLDRMVGS
jgi:protoheme IX farnesyltransferase